jgi:hypothetical protein
MTRKDDDKRGNREFEGSDPQEAEYGRKVEARFTKEATAKGQQGDRGRVSGRVGKSHADDGGEHKF